VRMRARKPCFFARRWLLGWNVRFTSPPRSPGERRPCDHDLWFCGRVLRRVLST
jgi:hypothetical protein